MCVCVCVCVCSSSVPSLYPVVHPRYTHSLPYSSFLLPLHLARRSGEALQASHGAQRKMTAGCRSWRGPNTPGPVISKVGRGASHGSYRAFAHMSDSTFAKTFLSIALCLCSSSNDDRVRFIILSIHRCLQHDRRVSDSCSHKERKCAENIYNK